MSARTFSKVSPAIWRPGRFLSLPTTESKLLYVYFLTCEHQNSAGCFRLPDGYACADLGWEAKQYQAERNRLVEVDLIAFDAATSEIYVERWFKHNLPANPKHKAGTRRLIEAIESDTIREKVEADFIEATEAPTANANPLDTPFDHGSRLINTGYMRRTG